MRCSHVADDARLSRVTSESGARPIANKFSYAQMPFTSVSEQTTRYIASACSAEISLWFRWLGRGRRRIRSPGRWLARKRTLAQIWTLGLGNEVHQVRDHLL